MKSSLRDFIASNEAGFYFIGHASALVRVDKELVLFDPIWRENPYENFIFVPEQVDCDEILSKITACVISHEHADHVSGSILSRLKCPIYIMGGRPRLTEKLKQFSKDVNPLPYLKWFGIGSVRIFFLPHAFNSVDSSCVIHGNNLTAYIGSDNLLDRKLCEVVANVVPQIDIAAIPYSFVHYYPHLLTNLNEKAKLSEIARLKKQSLDQAKMFIETVKPVITVPFGNNLLFCDGPDHILNRGLATPTDFYGDVFRAIETGDYILSHSDRLECFYQDEPKEPVKWKPLPPLKMPENFEIFLNAIQARVWRATKKVPKNLILVNNILINLENLKVTVCSPTKAAYNLGPGECLTSFCFDAEVFYRWANGDISFESALGTRRFKYSRNPNVYNLAVVEFYANFL